MKLLNLGAGKKLRSDAINVDITNYPGIDRVVDLSQLPWPWETESIDGIYVSHLLEHFHDQEAFILECYRVLKPGGFLRIAGPHSSSVVSIGCLGHYRTYSYDTFRLYLSEPWYMFKTKKFNTVYQSLNWWFEAPDLEGKVNLFFRAIISILNPIFNYLAKLSPALCENWWVYYVGGFREIVWKGEKCQEEVT